jgi:hypothetical protein
MKLNQEQLAEALSVSDDHPIIAAFLQIIADATEDDIRSAVMPNLSSEDRAFNCGRVAAIQDLSLFISSLRCEKELTSRRS